ncbi:envelope protein UL43 [Bovine alphaherpesvirus 5]|uniref:UL43 virion protein (Membrane) n=1 Tax=Bovine alphaherpesvirus 5 TaxID=35244 RepID=Q6X255_9ALPH|nr:UL43 virion protein (membrane) [Bovine alphaherpesvirus 5]AAR86118.1 UL43 virion protein (membrane) [Bovine alphaherpesvirus 5]AQM74732.1 envelope protein UL43 [Bovine alphaherpesvirus 5]ART33240.1 envelope protein UL43 [Bovine alphaherpesvirus 5]QVY10548.1 UL43 membrane virion protein [Bovine alphaherpesvirus 5]UHJ15440.1 UL43 virion protein [Bovine alphaherpesvirus 5]
MFASRRVSGCAGTKAGCGPCALAATGALAAMGAHTGLTAAALDAVGRTRGPAATPALAAAAAAAAALVCWRPAAQTLRRRLAPLGRLAQTLAVAAGLAVWAAGPAPAALRGALTAAAAAYAVCGVPVHCAHFVTAAAGTGAHFRTALLAMTCGLLLGLSAGRWGARPEALAAAGAAAALAVAAADAAAALEDTCHYKICRYAALRTLAPLGEAPCPADPCGAREDAVPARAAARAAAAELALSAVALAAAAALWAPGRALGAEGGGRWRTRGVVLLSVAGGHGVALAEHLCLRYARADAADGALMAHVGVCALGAALPLCGAEGGAPAALASATAGALVACVWVRRRGRGAARLAAAHVAKVLHAALCFCVGACWARADE